MLGDFQMENGAVAVGVLEAAAERGLEITREAMKEGFRTVSWPCRMEVLPGRPRIVCDGSHNPYSAAKLKATLPEYLDYSDVIMVAGVSADKNMGGIVAELAGMTRKAVVARSRHPRAADAEEVAAGLPHATARKPSWRQTWVRRWNKPGLWPGTTT